MKCFFFWEGKSLTGNKKTDNKQNRKLRRFKEESDGCRGLQRWEHRQDRHTLPARLRGRIVQQMWSLKVLLCWDGNFHPTCTLISCWNEQTTKKELESQNVHILIKKEKLFPRNLWLPYTDVYTKMLKVVVFFLHCSFKVLKRSATLSNQFKKGGEFFSHVNNVKIPRYFSWLWQDCVKTHHCEERFSLICYIFRKYRSKVV